MRLIWLAAAIAAAMSTAVPALAGGEWPDGPNKTWFENLQRPDNHLAPYRNIDRYFAAIRERPTWLASFVAPPPPPAARDHEPRDVVAA